MFEEFYTVYPKKTNKAEAEKLFNALSDGIQKEIINDVIDRKLHHGQWQDKTYIPNPARYLRRRLWKDEIIPLKTKEMVQAENEDGSIHSRLWTMLKQMYGDKFSKSYGETMPQAWKHGLKDITQNETSRLLRYLATDKSEFMPDLPKINRIRNIGRDLPVYRQMQIGNPSKPETVSTAIEQMMEMLR